MEYHERKARTFLEIRQLAHDGPVIGPLLPIL